jgi:hypothetical protein
MEQIYSHQETCPNSFQLIDKLIKVGKDKEPWKKAEEYLEQLQDDEHMMTLEDTDVAIKRAEKYLYHSDGAGSAIKNKVAFKADVGDAEDRDAKFAARTKSRRFSKVQLTMTTSIGLIWILLLLGLVPLGKCLLCRSGESCSTNTKG